MKKMTRILGVISFVAAELTLMVTPQVTLANTSWFQFGPKECEGTPGGCAGRTMVAVKHPLLAGVVYSGHSSGGLWKTINGGVSWVPLAKSGPIGGAVYRRLPAGGGDRLIVGTGTAVQGGDGIWTSDDDGASWTIRHSWSETLGQTTQAMAIDRGGNTVYAGLSTGLVRSTDGGLHWNQVPNLTTIISDVVTHPNFGSYAFAGVPANAEGVPAGIYRCKGLAGTFTRVTDLDFGVIAEDDWGSTLFGWAPSDARYMYVMVSHKTNGTGRLGQPAAIFRSHPQLASDIGANETWELVWYDFDHQDTSFYHDYNIVPKGFGAFAVALSDPTYLCAGGVGLFRSTDGGASWESVTGCVGDYSRIHVDIQHILPYVENGQSGFMISTDGGEYYHEADRTKAPCDLMQVARNGDLNTLQIAEAGVDPNAGWPDYVVAGTWDQGLWACRWYNWDWQRLYSGDWNRVEIGNNCLSCGGLNPGSHPFIANNAVGGAMTTSCDWFYNRTPTIAALDQPAGGPILPDLGPDGYLYSVHAGQLYRYSPGSCSPNPPTPIWSESGKHFSTGAIVPSGSGPARIYLGSLSGDVYLILLSDPVVASPLTSTVPPWQNGSPAGVSDIAVRPGGTAEADVVYLTIGIHNNEDGSYNLPDGNCWKHSQQGWAPLSGATLPHVPLHSLAVNELNPGEMWVAGTHDAYWTTDEGNVWHDCSYNMPDIPIVDLDYHAGSGTLYASTWGRSIWATYPGDWVFGGLSPTIITEGPPASADAPTGQVLRVEGRTLHWVAPHGGRLNLEMFDLQGRRLGGVFEGLVQDHQAGTFRPNVESLAKGVYLVRMAIDGVQVGRGKFLIR